MPGLRLVSYNVHYCRGLDWRVRPERAAEVIAALRPDVALLQELEDGARGHQPVLPAQRHVAADHAHQHLPRGVPGR